MGKVTAKDSVDRIVEQWGRERPELATLPMAVFGRIYRIARIVGDRQEAAYNTFGINRGEFDVLAALRRAGEPFQLSPTDLCSSLMLTSGGMTGRLDRLERNGFVTRSADPNDRRRLVITLTERGRSVVDQAVVAGLEAQHEVLDRLPEASRTQLADLLRDLLAAASGDDSTGR